LLAVLRGDLHFLGVRPRSRKEIAALDADWRDLYLKSKPGLVTEAFINYGDFPTEDELYTSEVFYVSTTGLVHDLKLFCAYIRKLFSRKSVNDLPSGEFFLYSFDVLFNTEMLNQL
jgi:lipopolysaccharide/colanic/teichoic acid biosynthesis glycosyltransferase